MAKIIPSTESTVNTLMPNVKFALGPLIIKKKITLIITVNIDKNPNILFVLLFKIEPSIPLVIFQQSSAIGKRLKLSPAFPLLHTERASFPAFRVPSNVIYWIISSMLLHAWNSLDSFKPTFITKTIDFFYHRSCKLKHFYEFMNHPLILHMNQSVYVFMENAKIFKLVASSKA